VHNHAQEVVVYATSDGSFGLAGSNGGARRESLWMANLERR
jgi:hypothetical protein